MESTEVKRTTPPPPQPPPGPLSDSNSPAVREDGATASPATGDASGGDAPAVPADAPAATQGVEVPAGVDNREGNAEVGVLEREDSGSDVGELPDLPALPEGDLVLDDEPSPPHLSIADDDFDLAPLPTEFDPDAPLPELPSTTVPEDDELAIVPREEPEPEPEPELAPELEPEQPEQPAATEVALADIDGGDGGEQPEQDILAVIRGLADNNSLQWVEGGEEHEPEVEAPVETEAGDEEHGAMEVDLVPEEEAREPSPAPSSPLSSIPPLSPMRLPELPNELSLDADIPTSSLPSSVLAPELQTSRPESSNTARRRVRAASASASPAPDEVGRRRRSAGRSDTDDRESDSGEKRERYKRRKGLDGKLIRASARPRKRIDKQLQIERHGQKPPEKVAPRARTLPDARLRALVRGKDKELQLAPCIRKRYDPWGKCTQCVSKIGGDSCRFRNYRVFPLNPETAEIIGPGTFGSTTLDEPLTPMPQKFNVELTEEHMSRIEKTVAPLLVGLISREMRHVIKNEALHRPIDTAQHRSVCDFCSSTIFAGFWFCTKCGRDYCIECERFFSADAATITTSPWPVPEATRPRLHRCTRGDDPLPLQPKPSKSGKLKQQMHFRGDLMAASRLSADELRADFLALIDFVLEPGASDLDVEARVASLALGDEETELADGVREYLSHASPGLASTKPPLSDAEVQALYDASTTLSQPPDPTDIPPLPFMYIDGDRLDSLAGGFDSLWGRGEPMVVDNLLKRLQMQWTPDSFIRRFKDEQCYVVDCESDKVLLTSVGAFFLLFKEMGSETTAPKEAAVAYGATNAPATNGTPFETAGAALNGVNVPAAGSNAGSLPPQSPHQPMAVDETTRTSLHEPTVLDAGAQQNGGAETVLQCSLSDQPSRPEVPNGSPSTTSAPPLSSASAAARPILPAPTLNGSAPGSGAGTPQRAYTFQEQVAQMASWAPGYAKLKAAQRIFKLKDWPSTDDFSTAYPDLYRDFSNALPAPDFTQRIGVLNLYSHFPPGPTRPDIGPKMYNALAGREDPGGFGSTRLHMDVADAVNIMLYASKRPDGSPGCAVWDLFRAEDADKIRAFLRTKFPHAKMTDPIHSQLFYLDSQLREELHAQYGVTSFRVYQYPGQAVFVPAGCAHQVCNLANCMKIALDFVSPHNVRRCQRLMQDFRKENYVRVWKEDVLQLYNVMWYAWTNVRGIREARKQKEITDREKAASHAEWLAHLKAGQGTHPQGHPAGRPPPYAPGVRYSYSLARDGDGSSRYLPFTSSWSSVRDDPSPRVGTESAIRGQSTPPVPAPAASALQPPALAPARSAPQPPASPPAATTPLPGQPTRSSPIADNASSTLTAEGPPANPTADSDAADNPGTQRNESQPARSVSQEPDKNTESASASARQIPPANGDAATVSTLPSPGQELVRRLLDAALAREPKPELHVDLAPKAAPEPEPYYRHNSFADDIGALPELMDIDGEVVYSDVGMLG
ncbi:hypothetical protein CspHIS471_0507890 [Cutaneotrichosporon sp. HIS471]|nr:hypothetical protein CspHIS471_0507890 [Cutaneotrichosporon sp. HIS471]